MDHTVLFIYYTFIHEQNELNHPAYTK